MSRYIKVSEDAIKGIFKKLNHKNIYPKSSDEMILRNYLDEFPTANVVEVVRCEKCRWGTMISRNYDGTLNIHCSLHNDEWFSGDFCNYGSKKERE